MSAESNTISQKQNNNESNLSLHHLLYRGRTISRLPPRRRWHMLRGIASVLYILFTSKWLKNNQILLLWPTEKVPKKHTWKEARLADKRNPRLLQCCCYSNNALSGDPTCSASTVLDGSDYRTSTSFKT